MRTTSSRSWLMPLGCSMLIVTLATARADEFLFIGQTVPPDQPLTLWYRRPAGGWLEALPLGNGRLGAMVYGGVPTERIALNDDTLWSGGPRDCDNPGALKALPEIRRLIFAGKFAEAQELGKRMM